MMPVKADLALPLACLDSIGVWLSCQAIIWISILAGLNCSGFSQIKSHTYTCVGLLYNYIPNDQTVAAYS